MRRLQQRLSATVSHIHILLKLHDFMKSFMMKSICYPSVLFFVFFFRERKEGTMESRNHRNVSITQQSQRTNQSPHRATTPSTETLLCMALLGSHATLYFQLKCGFRMTTSTVVFCLREYPLYAAVREVNSE